MFVCVCVCCDNEVVSYNTSCQFSTWTFHHCPKSQLERCFGYCCWSPQFFSVAVMQKRQNLLEFCMRCGTQKLRRRCVLWSKKDWKRWRWSAFYVRTVRIFYFQDFTLTQIFNKLDIFKTTFMYVYIYPLSLVTHSLIHNINQAMMHTYVNARITQVIRLWMMCMESTERDCPH